jgi:FixJ family two-component response regulator
MGVLARTIAVIDDDDRVLESLQNLLASCGYKAETYSSAELFSRRVRSLAPVALSQMSR